MNDFTKEELERLSRLAINASNRFNPNDTDSLCLKIQSMIDNYCDHDGEYVSDSQMVDICKQCGAVF